MVRFAGVPRSLADSLLVMLRCKISAVVVAAAMSGLALAASTVSAADTPRTGGTLIFGRAGDSVGLDPASRTDGESFVVTDHIFDTLVKLKLGTTEVAPGLARTWDITDGGKTYTFHLVPNVTFSDGTPVDADAIVVNFARQLDRTHRAYAWGGPYSYVEAMGLDKLVQDVSKKDALTVVFHLRKPSSPFISMLSLSAFGIVSPTALEKTKKDFAQHPVGSGPYTLRLWDKKQKIILVARPDYWGDKPLIKTLIFRSIPDNNTRLQEMLAGNLHVMDNPDTNIISTLEQQLGGKVKFAKGPGFNLGFLAFNMDKKPFDNVLVRQAIAHAINKKAIIAAVYNGYATVAKNPMPPSLWSYDDKIQDYDYNPAEAKALLKRAGLEAGFTTDLWAMPVARPYMPDGRKVAEAIQGDLAKIGITVNIVSYDWGTYLHKTEQGEHSMALTGWTGDIGDPDNFLYILLDQDNAVKPAQNLSFYRSAPLHDLLIKAQSEPDKTERTRLYTKAQEIIHADCPIVPLAHSLDVVPLKSEVEGFILDPTGRRHFASVWLNK